MSVFHWGRCCCVSVANRGCRGGPMGGPCCLWWPRPPPTLHHVGADGLPPPSFPRTSRAIIIVSRGRNGIPTHFCDRIARHVQCSLVQPTCHPIHLHVHQHVFLPIPEIVVSSALAAPVSTRPRHAPGHPSFNDMANVMAVMGILIKSHPRRGEGGRGVALNDVRRSAAAPRRHRASPAGTRGP